MVKKAFLIIMLLFVMLFVTGCQTIQGLGGDIRWLAGARDNPSGTRHSYSSSREDY
jgi:predicted small secreted protein